MGMIVKTDGSFAALHNMAQIRIYVCNMFLLDWIAVTNMRYNQIQITMLNRFACTK